MLPAGEAQKTLKRAVFGNGLVSAQPHHRESPPAHEPHVGLRGPEVPREPIRQSALMVKTESGSPSALDLARHVAKRALRIVKNFRPRNSLASLPDRSSKRNRPLVLGFTGGKAA